MEQTKQGKFIVIDGTDGSGKTTQLNLLKDKLIAEGYSVAIADFPQYNTKSAGMVEEYLSGKYGQANEVSPYQASIFFAIDRFDASAQIKSWLNEGRIVLANRYTSANLGHQGSKISNPLERKIFFNWLYDLEYKIFNIPKPDLSIILKVEPEISYQLAQTRKREDWKGKTTDIHENNLEHLRQAAQIYTEIVDNFPNFKAIKCTQNQEILSPEAIHLSVWIIVKQLLSPHAELKETGFQSLDDLISSNKEIIKHRDIILHSQAGEKPKLEENKINVKEDYPDNQDHSLVNMNLEERIVKIERITETARAPFKSRPQDAALDLCANDYYSIPPYTQALVSTGIKIAIPDGFVGLIWDKSSLANLGITTLGGVIDPNYRGEIKVIIKNLSEDIFNIEVGQKIAQLIIQAAPNFKIKEEKLSDQTDRNEAGFGSSGKF